MQIQEFKSSSFCNTANIIYVNLKFELPGPGTRDFGRCSFMEPTLLVPPPPFLFFTPEGPALLFPPALTISFSSPESPKKSTSKDQFSNHCNAMNIIYVHLRFKLPGPETQYFGRWSFAEPTLLLPRLSFLFLRLKLRGPGT